MTTNLRLLHVEDEPDIREITEFALEDEGFELFQCASGQAALELAETLAVDVLLLDVMMPGMDGPTTLQRLRALSHLADTPAIFMTAKVQPAEVRHLKELGAVEVIAKPFDPLALANQIRAIVERVNV